MLQVNCIYTVNNNGNWYCSVYNIDISACISCVPFRMLCVAVDVGRDVYRIVEKMFYYSKVPYHINVMKMPHVYQFKLFAFTFSSSFSSLSHMKLNF